MKNTPSFALAIAVSAGGAAFAQSAPQSTDQPDSTLAVHAGAITDYRYRGMSQTRLKPAVQGGADFSHKNGFYLGAWASSVKWVEDAAGAAGTEVDVYGGYRFRAGSVGIDVGALRYLYPGSRLGVNPDTTELYVAGTWGPATLKYSQATTNLFGFADSKGSSYVDLSGTFDTGVLGVALVPHVGYQKVKNNSASSYTDWSLTLTKDFGNGFTASLGYVDTDSGAYVAPNGRDLGKAAAVLGVKYTHAF